MSTTVIFHAASALDAAMQLSARLEADARRLGKKEVVHVILENEVTQKEAVRLAGEAGQIYLVDIDIDGYLVRMIRTVIAGPLVFVLNAEGAANLRKSLNRKRFQGRKILLFDCGPDDGKAISTQTQMRNEGAERVDLLEANQLDVDEFPPFALYDEVLIFGDPDPLWRQMFDARRVQSSGRRPVLVEMR